ncbi:uncharacterized protein [Rutidosis leptorrhynchoides]|uniref:uncharacterized protein n=1 Tax=Rutidosis leptorrhynchoides TaxID=125765 RepID=UPI003A993264
MRIPVRVELDKRGINLHSVRCPVCCGDLESVDHILVNCSFALDVWNRVYKWWNIGAFSSSRVSETLQGNSTLAKSAIGKKIWQAVEWVCAYYLWKNRNMKTFQNNPFSASVLISEIQVKSYEWISGRIKGKHIDWLTWLVNPYVYLD